MPVLGRAPWAKDETKEVPDELKETTSEQRAFLISIGAIGESMSSLLDSVPCCSSRKSSVRKKASEVSSKQLSQTVEENNQ